MGSAAAPVIEVGSDDDDGPKTTGAGKHKSPDGSLDWAANLLGEDHGAIQEDIDDSAAMEAFLASLLNQSEIVVDDKKGSSRDAGDDDDCVILDGDPDKAVAVAKEEGPRREDDELQIVAEKGEIACRDFPHPRHLCASLPFSTRPHASHCSMCHCYVCDSPAPCAFWGIGNLLNDHCHATDKDAKWNKLRQSSLCKSQPKTPKRGSMQSLFNSSATTPSSQPSANGMIPSTVRFAASSIVRQNQQTHPSDTVPQNMEQGICLPRVPSAMPRTTIQSNRSKRARAAPPVYMHSNFPSHGTMRPALPRTFQTAQVRPGGARNLHSSPSLLPLSAPIGSQGYQFQPSSYPQVVPNAAVGTGVPLSPQRPQGPSADTTLKDALANLAYELGVPDYNIGSPLGQQSASTQSTHSYPLLAQAKPRQGFEVNHCYVAASPQMRPSSGHTSLNHASGRIALSSGSLQTKQPLCQLNSQSSLTPSETVPSPL